MSDSIIKVSNLSKSYLLGHEGPKERYTALRDVIARNAKNILRSTGDLLRGKQVVGGDEVEEFLALKDVSFEVNRGEVLGIIGRNGAGKSTLLKILSRITEPTTGRIELNGRVSSLLEVGTGFHPELSGRENIFLNGAILGMTRAEIKRKFDEIVAFAEVERFLDTPVKRYSSGMYVRLAFAVAAHLDPEILIVDEVLAVGDAEFQKKCLGKMKDVATDGRTVLFVSHNITAIEGLTTRCLYLQEGKVQSDGTTSNVVRKYLDKQPGNAHLSIAEWKQRSGNKDAKIVSLETRDRYGKPCSTFRPCEPLEIKVKVNPSKPLSMDIAIVIEDEKEQPLFCSHLSDSTSVTSVVSLTEYSLFVSPNFLRPGKYLVSIAGFCPGFSDYYDVVLHYPGFEIAGEGLEYKVPNDQRWGSLYFKLNWKIN